MQIVRFALGGSTLSEKTCNHWILHSHYQPFCSVTSGDMKRRLEAVDGLRWDTNSWEWTQSQQLLVMTAPLRPAVKLEQEAKIPSVHCSLRQKMTIASPRGLLSFISSIFSSFSTPDSNEWIIISLSSRSVNNHWFESGVLKQGNLWDMQDSFPPGLEFDTPALKEET